MASTVVGPRDLIKTRTKFRLKTYQLVMAGLIPAISLRKAELCLMIEIAGTSPAMTKESARRVELYA